MTIETKRLARVAQFAADDVTHRIDHGIMDVHLYPEHQPCDYFAKVGYEIILNRIGHTQPFGQIGDPDEGFDAAAFRAARFDENIRVATELGEAKISKLFGRRGIFIGSHAVRWPDRIPSLVTWAGRQTLENIALSRQDAVGPMTLGVGPLSEYIAQLGGASGFDGSFAPTQLEVGFDVTNAHQMTMGVRIYIELLAIIGLETIPITIYPDGRSFGYEAGGRKWKFAMEPRGDYYGRWSTARPTE